MVGKVRITFFVYRNRGLKCLVGLHYHPQNKTKMFNSLDKALETRRITGKITLSSKATKGSKYCSNLSLFNGYLCPKKLIYDIHAEMTARSKTNIE